MGNSISRKTTLRLFADNSLLYRSIKTIHDRKQLQEDLTTLTKWAETWQMTFHPAKCYESQGTKAYQATTPESFKEIIQRLQT
jgi:hypothetical protein